VTQAEDVPKFNLSNPVESNPSDVKDELVLKHLNIDDDPTEDFLFHLKDACDWIKTSLVSTPKTVEGDNAKQVGVLVHCTQGISRSGSIVVAYCKRLQLISYQSPLVSTLPSLFLFLQLFLTL
jgi:dual specificity phosphatase 12